MPRKASATTARKLPLPASSWFVKAVAADRAREARKFSTAPRARSGEADIQAITYAAWLLRRDGIDLDALRAAAVAAVPVRTVGARGRQWDANTELRAQIDRARPTFKVRWEPTQHGFRPRFVEVFEFRGSYPHDLIHSVELPNWSAAWEEVVDLTEHALAA